jgi:S-adenosylmethionine synthetase
MSGALRVSESVTPGHVDRCADAIAERLVEEAVTRFGGARCGIEVALNAEEVVLQGYVLTLPPIDDSIFPRGYDVIDFASNDDLTRVVNETLVECGYAGPHEQPLKVRSQLLVDDIEDDEQLNSAYSDDQVIVVGFATPEDEHANLPIETYAAREAQRALFDYALEHPDVFGPDGKVLLGIRETDNSVAIVEFLNISIQHRAGVDYGELYVLLSDPILDALRTIQGLEIPDGFSAREFVINGRGEFSEGGVRGDTGLSGKKLVADLYGPRVPIGGGALAGKDQFKADRIGTLRARHIAVRLAAATGLSATTTLAWFPGEAEPRGIQAELSDGQVLSRSDIGALTGIGDFSIAAAVDELLVARCMWPDAQRQGYVGIGQRWDRA